MRELKHMQGEPNIGNNGHNCLSMPAMPSQEVPYQAVTAHVGTTPFLALTCPSPRSKPSGEAKTLNNVIISASLDNAYSTVQLLIVTPFPFQNRNI